MTALEFPSVSNDVPETRDIYINAGRNKGGPKPPLRGPVGSWNQRGPSKGGGVVPLYSFKVNRHGKAINSPIKGISIFIIGLIPMPGWDKNTGISFPEDFIHDSWCKGTMMISENLLIMTKWNYLKNKVELKYY